jgi:far upstream element-binding protein
MHVMIYGSGAFIQAAAPRVEELLAEGERAEREGPPPEEGGRLENGNSQKSTPADFSSALTLTRPYHTDASNRRSSDYRPATVAQLISNNPNVLNPTLGVSPDDLIEETVNVPNGVVGFLIGRGGENISSMQARSGCKVQIQKEHELQPGQTHRVITLQATSKEAIAMCREMVESMVQDRIRAAGGNTNSSGGGGRDHHHRDRDDLRGGGSSHNANTVEAKVSEALAVGHVLVNVDVPDADVGLIIGKGGTTIKSIQDSTGSAIQIPPAGNPDNPAVRTISITCPTEEGAQAAKARIESLLNSKPNYAAANLSHGGHHDNNNSNNGQPQLTIQVFIPDKDVGLCIGRQGCVIREMQSKTGTRIQIPSHPIPGQMHRVATVIGTEEGCNQARALIERIVTEQTSACVMSGTPFHDNNNRQAGGYRHTNSYANHDQNAAQSNDPAWQAYYAAQAMARQQQEEQLQQQQQQQQLAAGAAAAQPADAYHEQFFRYAYYYGEAAARQYYGSWSPPVGTPNPYGVNPNPLPAPTGDAGGLGGVAASPQASGHSPGADDGGVANHTTIRDTSVRKVSNLPAWMTKS